MRVMKALPTEVKKRLEAWAQPYASTSRYMVLQQIRDTWGLTLEEIDSLFASNNYLDVMELEYMLYFDSYTSA